MDTVKQRLQLGYYRGVAHAVTSMVRREGVGALFRSYPTTLAMNLPYGCVMVAANESLKKVLSPDGNFSLVTSVLAGSGAGATAAAFTTPLDNVKTRLQTQELRAMYETAPAKPSPAAPAADKPTLGNVRNSKYIGCASMHTKPPEPPCMATPKYSGGLDAAKNILRSEGVPGFFRGLLPRVITHAPAVAISWTTYESVKRFFTTN